MIRCSALHARSGTRGCCASAKAHVCTGEGGALACRQPDLQAETGRLTTATQNGKDFAGRAFTALAICTRRLPETNGFIHSEGSRWRQRVFGRKDEHDASQESHAEQALGKQAEEHPGERQPPGGS